MIEMAMNKKRIFVSISKVKFDICIEWVFFSTETRITIEKEKKIMKKSKRIYRGSSIERAKAERGVARKKDTV